MYSCFFYTQHLLESNWKPKAPICDEGLVSTYVQEWLFALGLNIAQKTPFNSIMPVALNIMINIHIFFTLGLN